MESLNSITPLPYMLSAAGYFTYLFLQKSYLQRIGYVLFFAGFVCHTAMIAYGFVESGHVPVGNLRETLSMAAWAMAGVYLMIQYRFNIKILGIYAAPFIALIMLLVVQLPDAPVQTKTSSKVFGSSRMSSLFLSEKPPLHWPAASVYSIFFRKTL